LDYRLGRLQEIYDSLPKLDCRKRCTDVCYTAIDLSQIEEIYVRLYLGQQGRSFRDFKAFKDIMNHSKQVGKHDRPPEDPSECSCLRCPYLEDGLRTIYEVRPLICRLYGLTRDTTCEHGCKPEGVLTDLEVRELYRRMFSILNEPMETRDLDLQELLQQERVMGFKCSCGAEFRSMAEYSNHRKEGCRKNTER
jgi:Fe-S-cluster containining protein